MLSDRLRDLSQGFEDPGTAFVCAHGLPRCTDLHRYAEAFGAFVRARAITVDSKAPAHARTPQSLSVDLRGVCRAFGIGVRETSLEPDQRGLMMPGLPVIVVNERDAPARQRYTIAHELAEHLVAALLRRRASLVQGVASALKGPGKERLCELAAAAILMGKHEVEQVISSASEGDPLPPGWSFSHPSSKAVGFSTVERMASLFKVSHMAAAIRLTRRTEAAVVCTTWTQAPDRSWSFWYVPSPPVRGWAKTKGWQLPDLLCRARRSRHTLSGLVKMDAGPALSGTFWAEATRFDLSSGPQVRCFFHQLRRTAQTRLF